MTTPSTVPTALLADIAWCESKQHQFDPDTGRVLRGTANHKDVGYFQINEYWNGKDAKRLGYNIYTEEGNIGYALYLYKTQGTKPWNSSKSCWGGSQAPPSQRLAAYL